MRVKCTVTVIVRNLEFGKKEALKPNLGSVLFDMSSPLALFLATTAHRKNGSFGLHSTHFSLVISRQLMSNRIHKSAKLLIFNQSL